jgi:hypothetical protein
MFQASTMVQVGNGVRTLFWCGHWLDGPSIEHHEPDLVATVDKRARKTQLTFEALQGDRWIQDISGSLSVTTLQQYVHLWSRL